MLIIKMFSVLGLEANFLAHPDMFINLACFSSLPFSSSFSAAFDSALTSLFLGLFTAADYSKIVFSLASYYGMTAIASPSKLIP